MRLVVAPMLLIWVLICLPGCTTKRATIAQIHLSNTVTSYHDTPNQAGLIIVAEREAEATLEFARLANEKTTLAGMQRHIRSGLHTVDPGHAGGTGGLDYGVRRATLTAIDHLLFAKDSDGASANIQESTGSIAGKAEEIVKRSDLMLAVGDEVLASSNREEASLFAQEFQRLAEQNLLGGTGASPQAYGLRQFRSDVEALIGQDRLHSARIERSGLLAKNRLLIDGGALTRSRN